MITLSLGPPQVHHYLSLWLLALLIVGLAAGSVDLKRRRRGKSASPATQSTSVGQVIAAFPQSPWQGYLHLSDGTPITGVEQYAQPFKAAGGPRVLLGPPYITDAGEGDL